MSTLNRSESIRLFCVDCVAGELGEIRNCQEIKCQLHPMRMGSTPKGLNKAKAIPSFCKECIDTSPAKCAVSDCSLHAFRTGKRTEKRSISEIFTTHIYARGDGSKAYRMEQQRQQHKREQTEEGGR